MLVPAFKRLSSLKLAGILLGAGLAGSAWAQPANDNFADAEDISAINDGLFGTATNNLFMATAEIGEPSHAGFPPRGTVWYRWIAPKDGEVQLDTLATTVDTVIAVYTGTTLGNLRQVAANDDLFPTQQFNQRGQSGFIQPFNGPSGLRFNARTGVTYYFVIGAKGFGGEVIFGWAYHAAGVFRFATEDVASIRLYNTNEPPFPPITSMQTPYYRVSEWETFDVGDASTYQTYYTFGVRGMLVTVTRMGGSTGRMLVDYRTEDVDLPFVDDIPAVGSPFPFGGDYQHTEGTLVFDDFEMTKRILIPVFPSFPTVQTNRIFSVVLDNARADDAESPNVAPPRIDGRYGRVMVRILDMDLDPVWQRNFQVDPDDPDNLIFQPTNSIFNFSRVAFRTTEDITNYWSRLRIWVDRYGTNREGVTLHYRINNFLGGGDTANPAELDNNVFPLQPGSDYATPTPADDEFGNNPIGIHGTNPDFIALGNYNFPGGGTLTWGQNDFQSKPIDFVVTNDSLVEFNEDFEIFLYRTVDNSTRLVGQVNETTVTILFDDQDPPAGSVDQYHNADFGAHMVPALITTPPNQAFPGADNAVYDLYVQPDNRTVIVGAFQSFNATIRNRIARLNGNGSLDTSFNPGSGANNFINAIVPTDGGRMIIGGGFTSYNGSPRTRVARINSNGSLDTTFNPGEGPNGTVWAVAAQPDGKVIIAGDFTEVSGVSRARIARLDVNGLLDPTFDPGPNGPDSTIWSVALQTDGRIVIGGEFQSISGQPVGGIARLQTNGTLDPGFFPGAGTDGAVYVVALQTDGKVVIGGSFTMVDFNPRNNLARLNHDGSLDMTFDPGSSGADDAVYAIRPWSGGLYVGGSFLKYNGTHRRGLVRLFSDGTVDTGFLDTAYNQFAGLHRARFNDQPGTLFTIGVQSDGYVMIGGVFHQVGGGQANVMTRPDTFDANLWTEPKARDGVRNRLNVARLVGGSTPGPGNIGFTSESHTANENQSSLSISLTRANGTLGFLSANFEVEDGLAQSRTDYIYNAVPPIYLTSWSLAYPASEPNSTTRMRSDGLFGNNFVPMSIYGHLWYSYTPGELVVTILNDTISQGNRDTTFRLSNPTAGDQFYLGGENIPLGGALGRSHAPLIIMDDDQRSGVLGFATANFVVSENVIDAVITVIRTNGSSGTVGCVVSTVVGGTATSGVDYFATNRTLNFGPGVTNASVAIRIVDDAIVEPDETIFLRLAGATGGATLGLTNAIVTIIDNDTPGGRVNFSSPTFSTNENAGAALITVTRSGSSLGTLTVKVGATNGTAVAGEDFIAVTNTLSWASGDTSPRTVVVPLLDDSAIEPDETVNLRLFEPTLNGSPNPASLGAVSTATLIILNDDFAGQLAFSTSTYFANEHGGPAIVTVVRSGGDAESVTVNFAATGGTAVAGVDFSPTNGTLSFGPGEVSKSFAVPIHNNLDTDGTRFISLSLSGFTPSGSAGSPVSAIINIIDDESVNEPPGGLDTLFTPSGMNDGVFALALQSDGKILAGGDFTQVNLVPRHRIVRLGALQGTVDALFTASANGTVRSIVAQSDGRIVVGGAFTAVNSVVRNYVARLNSNGSLDSTFDPGSGADMPVFGVAESLHNGERKVIVGGAFTVFNGIPRNGIVRLNSDGSVDHSFNPGLGADGVVYAVAAYPTNSVHAGKVLVGGEFSSVAGVGRAGIARLNVDGSVDLTFDPGAGADDAVRAIALQTDGRILIGGSFTNFNGAALSRFARLNSNGSIDMTFNPGEGANDTVTAIAVQGDTRIVLGGQFTRCNGVTRHRVTRLNNDGTVDPTINFGSGADNFIAATVVQPDGKIIIGGGFTEYDGEPRSGIARIYGGSIAGSGTLEFTAAEYTVLENGTNAVITVRRRGGTSGMAGSDNISVDVVTSDGTATNGVHYIGGATPLIFPPGEVFQKLLIPIIDDFEINTNRTVHLSLENLQPPGAPALGNQPVATLTIINDDSAISFSSPVYTVNEAVVGGLAMINIVRTGSTRGESSVEFITMTNGTATADVDFLMVSNLVTFAEGETVKSVTVPIINDMLVEGNETVLLRLQNPNGALLIAPDQAVLTIVDDDFGPGEISFATTNYFARETDGVAVIAVARLGGSSGTASIKYTTGGGTALAGLDYTTATGTVAFESGETNKSFTVTLLRNPMVTGDLTIGLTLSDPSGAALVPPTTATLVIDDVDTGFRFSSPAFAAIETSENAILTVQRIGATNNAVSVSYATTNGNALAGTHYQHTSGTLSFAPGETFKTFSVPLIYNPAVEGNLAFHAVLSSPSPGTQLANPSMASVSLIDVDIGFSVGPFTNSVAENATNIVVPIIRTGSMVGEASVNYATANGTAVAGADYTPVSGTLVFGEGVAIQTVTIPILDDKAVEGDEEFFISLGGPSAGAFVVAPASTNIIILDNDSGFRFSSAEYAVSESGVNALISVLRTGTPLALSNTVTVSFATSDGTANAGIDYVATNGVFTFTNGQTARSFQVRIIDDTEIEGDQTVNLTLSNPIGEAAIVEPGSATLSIIDNDGSLIVGAGAAMLSESGAQNGVIDPGETVSLLFALRNSAGARSTNLVATLLATNGVTSPSGPQLYGALDVDGPSVSRPFTFTANGTNGGTLRATFRLQDGLLDLGTVVFSFTLGNATLSFTNQAAITIPDNSPAVPYPSSININGLAGVVSKATVTLTNMKHGWPNDVQALLVSPSNQRLTLMANAGGGIALNNVTVTFDDAAAANLPQGGPIVSGTYKPSTYGVVAPFPAPAPSGPHGTTLSVVNGTNPNGVWSLYLMDKSPLDSGIVSNGWVLTLTVAGVVPAAADLSVGITHAPETVLVSSNLTYTVVVTNHGPSTATGITVTNPLPAGLNFISAIPSQGSAATNGSGQLVWNIGTLAIDGNASLSVLARPSVIGPMNLTATATAAEFDPNTTNNAALDKLVVEAVTADVAVSVIGFPNPVVYGSTVTYAITVTNAGPGTASAVALTNQLPVGINFVSASTGGFTVSGGTITFTNLGSFGAGASQQINIVAQPGAAGSYTNTVGAGSPITDPLKGNNVAAVKTEVFGPEVALSRDGNNLVIAWPADAAGFTLWRATSMAQPIIWTQVTTPVPVTVGNQKVVTLPIGSGTEFFRLQASP